MKCKTRFQADESASKRFGLFSSPIETALSADVSPLQRLKSAYHVECEAPCAATTAASHPSSCRQRSPPLRRREEEQARYIVRGCSCGCGGDSGLLLWPQPPALRRRGSARTSKDPRAASHYSRHCLHTQTLIKIGSYGLLTCDVRLDKLGRKEYLQILTLSKSNPLCKHNDLGRAEHVSTDLNLYTTIGKLSCAVLKFWMD